MSVRSRPRTTRRRAGEGGLPAPRVSGRPRSAPSPTGAGPSACGWTAGASASSPGRRGAGRRAPVTRPRRRLRSHIHARSSTAAAPFVALVGLLAPQGYFARRYREVSGVHRRPDAEAGLPRARGPPACGAARPQARDGPRSHTLTPSRDPVRRARIRPRWAAEARAARKQGTRWAWGIRAPPASRPRGPGRTPPAPPAASPIGGTPTWRPARAPHLTPGGAARPAPSAGPPRPSGDLASPGSRRVQRRRRTSLGVSKPPRDNGETGFSKERVELTTTPPTAKRQKIYLHRLIAGTRRQRFF